MFQRTLLRQAQAARSVLAASTSTSTAPLALRRTTRLQQRLPTAIRPFAQPVSRFYSTENKEASQETEGGENAEAEDPVHKELEEKKKEIVDLKVFVYCTH